LDTGFDAMGIKTGVQFFLFIWFCFLRLNNTTKRSEFLPFSLLFILFGKLAWLWIFSRGWKAEMKEGKILDKGMSLC